MSPSPLWMLAWRCLYALAVAVAPWALPLEPRPPASADAALVRVMVGWVGLALLVAALVRARRRAASMRVPLALASTLVIAAMAGAGLTGGTVPLGASAWALTPLAGALAVSLALRAPEGRRRAALALTAVACAATVVLSLRAMRSVDAMWEATLRRAPGHPLAAAQVARATAARGDREGATLTDPDALVALGRAEAAAGRYNSAREALLRATRTAPSMHAPRYELARLTHGAGADQEARHHVEVLLRHHPGDARALTLLRDIDGAGRR